MTQQNYKILVERYEKDPGNKLLGKEHMRLTNEELAKRMRFKSKYGPFIGRMYSIESCHLNIIQPLVKHLIELDKNDYVISSLSL